ncbi:MAG: ATP-binding protein [Myxococcales bacterium]|nr:ATP-binding protein [Myxococcales bacterium]
MTDRVKQLEQQLLRDPFDAAARGEYAELLLLGGHHEQSLSQWLLLLKQEPKSAAAHLGAARCCHERGDGSARDAHLEDARACEDFDADDPFVRSLAPAEETRLVALRGLAGGKQELPARGEVISIASTDKVRFADVVGMKELKKLIRLRIIEPFLKPGLFQRFKKRSGGGVLLYGPPGCGKTLIARAIATECEAAFTPIGISDILNMWIGESERNLAAIFEKARQQSPSVLFFDELDALAYARSKANSDHTRTLVNEFLNQLDGMSGRNDRVLVLAATNMPWDVDEAMKRPGRFDRQIFVPPPDAEARAEMLRMKLCDVPTDWYDERALSAACHHFSGADIDGLIERAKDEVLAEILDSGDERNLTHADLAQAAEAIEPTTLEWLKTARNLVKFGGAGAAYKDVEKYLRSAKLY